MAVRKSQLYRSLWDGCDALRGGVEPSQYKDYILMLLFLEYVTDKYLNEEDADIRVFDREHDMAQDPRARTGCSFNDKNKLGKGVAMVKKLSGLVGIFQCEKLDFSGNRAEGIAGLSGLCNLA